MTIVITGVPQPKGSMWGFVDKKTGRVRLQHGARAKKRPDGTRDDTAKKRYAAYIKHVDSNLFAEWTKTRPVLRDDDAYEVTLNFFLPRPESAPRSQEYPIRKPDLDKLTRLILDALTKARLIADDARIVNLNLKKRFGEPRVEITIANLLTEEPLLL